MSSWNSQKNTVIMVVAFAVIAVFFVLYLVGNFNNSQLGNGSDVEQAQLEDSPFSASDPPPFGDEDTAASEPATDDDESPPVEDTLPPVE